MKVLLSLPDSHLVAYSYYACLGFLNILLDIVMCAGSSKSLEIYDMNVGKCARTITDVHTRPVHCIKQHEVLLLFWGGIYLDFRFEA